jgi:protein subunit release factor A
MKKESLEELGKQLIQARNIAAEHKLIGLVVLLGKIEKTISELNQEIKQNREEVQSLINMMISELLPKDDNKDAN